MEYFYLFSSKLLFCNCDEEKLLLKTWKHSTLKIAFMISEAAHLLIMRVIIPEEQ